MPASDSFKTGAVTAISVDGMDTSRHLSIHIDRPLSDVYAYAGDPANLPQWAPGLAQKVEQVDGQWWVDSPMGRIKLDYAPRNDFGVLDHSVTLPDGDTNYNPVRALADGDGTEVVFTLRRRPGVTDDEFARDEQTIRADLDALKRIVEKH